MGKIYKNSILYATGANDAKHIMYDNTDSGLAAATTQAALDELSTKMDNTPTSEEVEQVTIDAPADRDADILGGKYRSSDIDDLVDGAVAAAAGISSLNSSVGSINTNISTISSNISTINGNIDSINDELSMTPKSQEVSTVTVDIPNIDADVLGGRITAADIDEKVDGYSYSISAGYRYGLKCGNNDIQFDVDYGNNKINVGVHNNGDYVGSTTIPINKSLLTTSDIVVEKIYENTSSVQIDESSHLSFSIPTKSGYQFVCISYSTISNQDFVINNTQNMVYIKTLRDSSSAFYKAGAVKVYGMYVRQ